MTPLAICAIFKNEGPYILEWVAYHRAVGFDHFVLYDNASTDGGSDVVRSSSLSRHRKPVRAAPQRYALPSPSHRWKQSRSSSPLAAHERSKNHACHPYRPRQAALR